MTERERIKCGQCFGFYEHDVDCDGHPESAATLRSERDAALAELAEAKKKLERDRIRLAACGVVAMSNTSETAARNRDMLPEYRSASCDDVATAVDREMALRAELAEVRRERDEARIGQEDALAALNVSRSLGMSIEPCPGDGLVWAMKNERAQHAEAEADAYRARVSVEEGARAEVEKALRSTTARAEAAESRLAQAEAALREVKGFFDNSRRAESKGAREYDVTFMRALVEPVIEAALSPEPSPLLAKMEAAKEMAKFVTHKWTCKSRDLFFSEAEDKLKPGECDCGAGEALRLWKEAGGR